MDASPWQKLLQFLANSRYLDIFETIFSFVIRFIIWATVSCIAAVIITNIFLEFIAGLLQGPSQPSLYHLLAFFFGEVLLLCSIFLLVAGLISIVALAFVLGYHLIIAPPPGQWLKGWAMPLLAGFFLYRIWVELEYVDLFNEHYPGDIFSSTEAIALLLFFVGLCLCTIKKIKGYTRFGYISCLLLGVFVVLPLQPQDTPADTATTHSLSADNTCRYRGGRARAKVSTSAVKASLSVRILRFSGSVTLVAPRLFAAEPLAHGMVLTVQAAKRARFVSHARATTAQTVGDAYAHHAAQRWSSAGGSSEFNLKEHFGKHGKDFKAKNREDYFRKARSFADNPPEGTLTKVRSKFAGSDAGDTVRYNPKTEEFVIKNASGEIKTYYKPSPTRNGKSNLEYFYGQ